MPLPLPTPARSWTFYHEETWPKSATLVVQCATILRIIKDRFKAVGWTVWGSCWLSAFGNGDGVDRWTSSTPTWTNEWIVLEHATICGGIKLLIHCFNGTTTPADYLSVSISKLGFGTANGGTNGNGSGTPPTALDQVYLNYGQWGPEGVTNRIHYLHTMLSNDGTSMRMFFMHASCCTGFWMFDTATPSDPAWTGGAVCRMVGTKALSDIPTLAATAGFADNYEFKAWMSGTEMRLGVLAPSVYVNPMSHSLGSPGTLADKVENNITDGYPLHEILLHCNTPPYQGIKGKLVDMWWGGRRYNGECFPDDTTRQFTQFGALTIPWDGTDPITCRLS